MIYKKLMGAITYIYLDLLQTVLDCNTWQRATPSFNRCRGSPVFLIDMGVPGARELGQVACWGLSGKMQAKLGAHRLAGLISCLVFVPRLDHPYMVPTECVGMEIVP